MNPTAIPEWIKIGKLVQHPIASFFMIFFGTWFTEDGALIASATLWKQGRVAGTIVYWANVSGITIGDMLLYWLGYKISFGLEKPWVGRFIRPEMMTKGRDIYKKWGHGLTTLARFVPGLRLPAYTAAGLMRAPFVVFSFIVFVTGLIWVGVQMKLVEAASNHVSGWQLFWGALCVLFILQWLIKGFDEQGWRRRWLSILRLSRLENWPRPFKDMAQWPQEFRLMLQYGDSMLPSLANPGLKNGGLIGSSKSEILRLIPPDDPALLKWQLFKAGSKVEDIEAWLKQNSFRYPFMLKPDIGRSGSGVQWIVDHAQLGQYLAMAKKFDVIAQEYCPWPNEIFAFYARLPEQAEGEILILEDKIFPQVVGDGIHSLGHLIVNTPGVRRSAEVHFQRHEAQLRDVLLEGEAFRLTECGSRSQGTRFIDASELYSVELRRALDRLSNAMPGFYIGSFDIRYESPIELRHGNFKLIEINGGISGPYHSFRLQRDRFFAFGKLQRDKGLKPMSTFNFLRETWKYRSLVKKHPWPS